MTSQTSTNNKRVAGGFALLLALIISSVVLAIGLTLLSVTLKYLNLSATGRESEVAFQMANLGMECGRYWREEKASDFTNPGVSKSSLNIICNNVPVALTDTTFTHTPDIGSGRGWRNKVEYKFNVGSTPDQRCVEVEVNVIGANQNISNLPVGVGRVNTNCTKGDICTVIVSQGYNRACDAVTGSIFSVQRELTAEF